MTYSGLTEKPKGAFTFVLHSHLPYCRRAGRWPHGEEWLHEAATGTYLPLLIALSDLAEEGCAYRLTIGLTPVLCEQLADPLVLQHLEDYLRERLEKAQEDRTNGSTLRAPQQPEEIGRAQ